MLLRWCMLLTAFCLITTLQTYAQPEHSLPVDTAHIHKMLQAAKQHVVARKFDSAYILYKTAFQSSRQINYNSGAMQSLNGLGNAEAELGQYERSVYFLDHAVRVAMQMPDSGLLLPFIYSNLATTYTNWGDFGQGLKYYELAIATNERHPNAQLPLDAIYINVGHLLNSSGRYNEALFYLHKGVTIAWYKGSFSTVALLHTHIGNAFLGKQVWDSAAAYFRLALSEAKVIKGSYTEFLAYKGLADIALKRAQPELAIYYLKQATVLNVVLHPNNASETSIALGDAYAKIGNTSLALYHLNNALAESRSMGVQQNSMEAHKKIADIYASHSDFENAYKHQKSAWALSDSIHDYKRMQEAVHIEARFRSTIKDKELREKQLIIELKEREISARNIWIGISIAGLIVACIIILLLNRNYRSRQALKDAHTHQLLRQQQLHEFRSILQTEEKERNRIARDLHDGVMIQFSVVKMNLSALSGTPNRYIEKAQLLPHIQQLNAATQALRKVAHHLMPDMLMEGGLAEALYYFCKSLQPDVSFQIRYEQMDEIPRFDLQIEIAIYRIVQELVQNIIKHAGATDAFIQISYADHCLGIEVEDNGLGMKPQLQLSGKGMGLKNIETRIRHLNGNMHISSNDNGTSISLEFNLEQLEQNTFGTIHETT